MDIKKEVATMLGLDEDTGRPTNDDALLDEGGLANREPYRFDMVPPKILMAMAMVMSEGSKDHIPGGWRRIPTDQHIGRAMGHIVRFMQGEEGENHLAHAACRLAFAIELGGGENTNQVMHGPTSGVHVRVGDSHYGPSQPPVDEGKANERLARTCPNYHQAITGGPRLAYLCHPHGEDPKNVERAINLGEELQRQMDEEGDPTYIVVPHVMWPYRRRGEREMAMLASLEVMRRCNLILIPEWVEITGGIERESDEAERLGIPRFLIKRWAMKRGSTEYKLHKLIRL